MLVFPYLFPARGRKLFDFRQGDVVIYRLFLPFPRKGTETQYAN
ncbi:hypothetical protein CKA32_006185 [Geitlerinema sp. FC II]|nr:hypothetical protein CKA32_006185 [Geitlerinema sp. FC II]